jgi:hypothetical protein
MPRIILKAKMTQLFFNSETIYSTG